MAVVPNATPAAGREGIDFIISLRLFSFPDLMKQRSVAFVHCDNNALFRQPFFKPSPFHFQVS